MAKRRSFAALAVGISVILVSVLTGHHLPLYDGVSLPDEPYRYVKPPEPSLKTKLPPSSAVTTIAVQDGSNKDVINIFSDESGYQVSAYISVGALQTGHSIRQMAVTAKPEAPYGTQPSDGKVAGNIYHLSATSLVKNPSPTNYVSFVNNPKDPSYIDLRLPQGFPPGATIEYRQKPDGPWSSFPTSRVGNDIYEAPITDLGDYTMVVSSNTNFTTPPRKKSVALIISIMAAVVTLAAIIGTIRHKSSGKK